MFDRRSGRPVQFCRRHADPQLGPMIKPSSAASKTLGTAAGSASPVRRHKSCRNNRSPGNLFVTCPLMRVQSKNRYWAYFEGGGCHGNAINPCGTLPENNVAQRYIQYEIGQGRAGCQTISVVHRSAGSGLRGGDRVWQWRRWDSPGGNFGPGAGPG